MLLEEENENTEGCLYALQRMQTTDKLQLTAKDDCFENPLQTGGCSVAESLPHVFESWGSTPNTLQTFLQGFRGIDQVISKCFWKGE